MLVPGDGDAGEEGVQGVLWSGWDQQGEEASGGAIPKGGGGFGTVEEVFEVGAVGFGVTRFRGAEGVVGGFGDQGVGGGLDRDVAEAGLGESDLEGALGEEGEVDAGGEDAEEAAGVGVGLDGGGVGGGEG